VILRFGVLEELGGKRSDEMQIRNGFPLQQITIASGQALINV